MVFASFEECCREIEFQVTRAKQQLAQDILSDDIARYSPGHWQRDWQLDSAKVPDDYDPRLPRVYKDCIAELFAGKRFSREDSLNTCRKLCSLLGFPERRLKGIHIAGSTGKGTVASSIAGILTAQGISRWGLFTSPHLVSCRERICIGPQPISMAEMIGITNIVRAISEANQVGLKFFPWLTVTALVYFAWRRVDLCIIETGMGGKNCATNILDDPLVTCITNIGAEHEDILGPYPTAIADSKAGIMKPGVTCIIGPDVHPLEIFVTRADTFSCELIRVPPAHPRDAHAESSALARRVSEVALQRLGRPAPASLPQDPGHARCRLFMLSYGCLQKAAHHLAQAQCLDVPSDSIPIPSCLVIDIAHSRPAMTALARDFRRKFLSQPHQPSKFILLFALSGNRDLTMIDALAQEPQLISAYYLNSHHCRIIPAAHINEAISEAFVPAKQREHAGSDNAQKESSSPVSSDTEVALVTPFLKASSSIWNKCPIQSILQAAFCEATANSAALLITGSCFVVADVFKALGVTY